MKTYDIEFSTTVYINIPVEAESLEEAQAIADKALTRHSIQSIELSDDMPEGSEISLDYKGWELNPAEYIEDEDEDEDDDEDEIGARPGESIEDQTARLNNALQIRRIGD